MSCLNFRLNIYFFYIFLHLLLGFAIYDIGLTPMLTGGKGKVPIDFSEQRSIHEILNSVQNYVTQTV